MLTPLLGMAVLFAIAVALSSDRSSIRLRTVGPAFALQAAFAALVLYSDAGTAGLDAVVRGANHFISFAESGSRFVFGPLTDTEGIGFVFAAQVLPIIIFIAAFTAGLYHLGIMQRVVGGLGGALRAITGTSRPESTCAAGNIFLGMSEAPLLVKPYIASMTQSELFAVMTGGLATVAGSVMFGYAALGVDLKYLIAASFMAAPGGLLMAKILVPETDSPKESLQQSRKDSDDPVNIIDAIAQGAMNGAQIAVAIGAMLIAFISLIALFNSLVGLLGNLVGIENLTMELILGWLFAPLAFLLGIPWEEAVPAGSLIGQKLVLNEFVAYISLTSEASAFSPHAKAVVTIALCGFANFASLAILLGAIGSVVPSRRPDIAKLGLRAVAAASLANLMSAALASFFLAI